MQIRKATPDDAFDIKTIHVAAYKVSYKGYLPDDYLAEKCVDDEIVARTREYLKQAECYVVEEAGKTIALMYISYPDEAQTFEIQALYVHPDFQKQGAGSLLVDYILKEKSKSGYIKCVVWTMKSGPSLPFYLKKGFNLTTQEKLWIYEIPIIMLERSL